MGVAGVIHACHCNTFIHSLLDDGEFAHTELNAFSSLWLHAHTHKHMHTPLIIPSVVIQVCMCVSCDVVSCG